VRARTLRVLAVAAGAVLSQLFTAPAATAHPLGNFTVNRATAIAVRPGEVVIAYTIDMAEIPTYQEMPAIDADGDGAASPSELTTWARTEQRTVLPGLVVRADGRPIALTAGSATTSLLPGQAGLDTLRFEALFSGRLDRSSGDLTYLDRNADDGRIGWREVTAFGDGVELTGSDVPTVSTSDQLRSYPQDMLSSPLHVSSMAAGLTVTGPALGIVPGAAGASGPISRPQSESAGFAGVLADHGIPLVVLGLLVAFGFGAWHALLPGHGKTLMAGAMVGAGARPRQALVVATAVASMHSATVIALGVAVVALQRTFRPEVLYPWLGTLSGIAAVGVGLYLVRTRWASWRHQRHHEHGHTHTHEHGAPASVIDPGGRLTGKGIATLAFAGGALPAPSALLAMLAAIQVHRVAYGLALVAAFSAGLAAALLGVGVGALRARDAIARRAGDRVARTIPLVSAAVIVVAGLVVAVRAARAI
jgi:ABC-type nickel/cobalt efflux system permease component RcnA